MDLNQVTLPVVDLNASIAFYQALGCRLIVRADKGYARFELPSGSSTLSLHIADGPVTPSAMLYFEVDDVDAAYRRLMAQGIVFSTEPIDQPWRWREARFQDPSGHPLCLFRAGSDRRFPPWRLEPDS